MGMRQRIGSALARYLACDRPGEGDGPTSDLALLQRSIRPGDVLLVEGTSRFSTAIKYLTQSTWSHAALCVQGAPGAMLVEADVNEGVREIPLAGYAGFHTRICRPVGLGDADREAVIAYARARIGDRYDLRHIIDLARYLVPTPPVPVRWRWRMLSLGSGDPTRAICSSLIAQAFQSVHYPILPVIEYWPCPGEAPGQCVHRTVRRRHHTLFTPRDFDISPYFGIVKPVLEAGFDPAGMAWVEPVAPTE